MCSFCRSFVFANLLNLFRRIMLIPIQRTNLNYKRIFMRLECVRVSVPHFIVDVSQLCLAGEFHEFCVEKHDVQFSYKYTIHTHTHQNTREHCGGNNFSIETIIMNCMVMAHGPWLMELCTLCSNIVRCGVCVFVFLFLSILLTETHIHTRRIYVVHQPKKYKQTLRVEHQPTTTTFIPIHSIMYSVYVQSE